MYLCRGRGRLVDALRMKGLYVERLQGLIFCGACQSRRRRAGVFAPLRVSQRRLPSIRSAVDQGGGLRGVRSKALCGDARQERRPTNTGSFTATGAAADILLLLQAKCATSTLSEGEQGMAAAVFQGRVTAVDNDDTSRGVV